VLGPTSGGPKGSVPIPRPHLATALQTHRIEAVKEAFNGVFAVGRLGSHYHIAAPLGQAADAGRSAEQVTPGLEPGTLLFTCRKGAKWTIFRYLASSDESRQPLQIGQTGIVAERELLGDDPAEDPGAIVKIGDDKDGIGGSQVNLADRQIVILAHLVADGRDGVVVEPLLQAQIEQVARIGAAGLDRLVRCSQ